MKPKYPKTFFVAGLVVFFVIADRIVGWFVFKPDNPYARLREYIRKPQSSPLYLPQPYLNYTNNPESATPEGERQINALGMRHSQPVQIPKPKTTCRVLFVGGSTTFGEVDKTSDAFPALSEKMLNDSLDAISSSLSEVECLNMGVGAATSAEILIGYLLKLKYLDPDVVVIHAGINDAFATAHMPGYVYQPDYHTCRTIMQGVQKPSALMRFLAHSYIATYCMARWCYEDQMESCFTHNEFFQYHKNNIWFAAGNDSIGSLHYNAFYNNLTELVRTIRSSGGRVVLVTELVEKDQMPEQLQSMLLDGIEQNKLLMIRVATDMNVPVCVLKKEDFPARYFLRHDGIHLNKDGEKLLAEKLKPYLFSYIRDTKAKPAL